MTSCWNGVLNADEHQPHIHHKQGSFKWRRPNQKVCQILHQQLHTILKHHHNCIVWGLGFNSCARQRIACTSATPHGQDTTPYETSNKCLHEGTYSRGAPVCTPGWGRRDFHKQGREHRSASFTRPIRRKIPRQQNCKP